MAEELKRVESFSELKAGMIVVCKPCKACGLSHRGILTTMNTEYLILESGAVVDDGSRKWRFVPSPSCAYPAPVCVSEQAVRTGKVFRVIDGLSSHTQETTTKRERVRG